MSNEIGITRSSLVRGSEDGMHYLEKCLTDKKFMFETLRLTLSTLEILEMFGDNLKFSLFSEEQEYANSSDGLIKFLKTEASHPYFENLEDETYQKYWNNLGSFFESIKNKYEIES